MTTETTSDVNATDPDGTGGGGTTDGHPEGNSIPTNTTTTTATKVGTDGHPEGNTPAV